MLSKVITVLRYCKSSWTNSAFVKKQCPCRSRLYYYFDLIFCFLRYGDDFNDYCTFEFWNKNSKERDSYISLRRNDVLRFSLSTPSVYKLFLDKAAFNRRFAKYVKRGWITTEGNELEDLWAFVDKYESVIAKPLSDFGGHGVFKLSKTSPDYPSNLVKLNKIVSEGCNYILEETIVNCDELRKIAPGSLNTLRFVTIIDKNKKLHIVASLLRMGNGKAITDNYHDGGMACAIDLNTGKMRGSAYGMNCVSFADHPYSHIKFNGYQISNYGDCLEAIKEIAFLEPDARYVGWDIALTPNGIELLEGNIPPGEDITQIATGCGMWFSMQEWI